MIFKEWYLEKYPACESNNLLSYKCEWCVQKKSITNFVFVDVMIETKER